MNVLFLTPLALEQKAVSPHLVDAAFHLDGSSSYLKGQFKGRHQSYEVVVYETGAKNSPVALATERAIQAFKPSIAILLGIAGGVKDVQIGDVVVATKAYGYESGKDTESGFVYRPEVYASSKDLVAQARIVSISNDWKKRSKYAEGKEVVFGPIASGDKVIATTDSANYRNIKLHMNDTVALEMEAIGFGHALSNHTHIHAINIRSISDLLDHKSESDGQDLQQHAASNAAAFAFEMLYQLDPKQMNFHIMTTKELSKAVFENILPALQAEISGNKGQGDIWDKIKPQIYNELAELKDDPEDEDAKAAIRLKLKKTLDENAAMKQEVERLLQKDIGGSQIDNSVKISDSKNVIQGNNISVGGNFNVGDKTTIGKKYQVSDVTGNVYIADTINIEKAAQAKAGPLMGIELSELKTQVMQNKIKPALNALIEHSAHDGDLQNQAILLASRWNQLQRETNMNTVSKSHANVEFNRIRAALLDVIDEMETSSF